MKRTAYAVRYLQIKERDLTSVIFEVTRLISLNENVICIQMPDQKRRMDVMKFYVFPYCSFRFIGITIPTEIGAGIVPADVAALDAETAAPQSVVLDVAENAVIGFPEHVKRHTAGHGDPVLRKCIACRTGLDREAVFCRDLRKTLCDRIFLRIGEGNEFRHIVNAELEVLRTVLPYVENDSRQGFHAEAGCRLFDPERIRAKIGMLEHCI